MAGYREKHSGAGRCNTGDVSLSLSLSDVPGSPLVFDTLKEFIILAKVVGRHWNLLRVELEGFTRVSYVV